MSADDLPDWERLLSAERHLQALVPGTVLVGGTAAALHAGRPQSLDGDHVIEDLRSRFDEVLAALEAAAGWQTARVRWPVAILGRLDGVMTGIRQRRRTRPLESEVLAGLRVPTLYAQSSGASPLVEVVERLATAAPTDAPDVDLRSYKGLVAPWNDWEHLAGRGRHWAGILARGLLGGDAR
jgi:hypothetical protein